jgi:hypothetical protein
MNSSNIFSYMDEKAVWDKTNFKLFVTYARMRFWLDIGH